MTEENKIWIAAHLYYTEWEELLIKGIKPFVEEMQHKGLAEQFFFIRYSEKGPHIRLRFKTGIEMAERYLKPAILAHFGPFFDQHPSERKDPQWLKAEEKHQWYPNNSVQFVAYEPEIKRYGGEAALQVAEAHFQDASKAVLAAISEASSWDYETALGTAIKMHLAFAVSFGMNERQAARFFEYFFFSWLPRAYEAGQEKQSNEQERQRIRQETLTLFEQALTEQKEGLQAFAGQLLEGLNEGMDFDEGWMNEWVDALRACHTALECTPIESNCPESFKSIMEGEHDEQYYARLYIAQSYMHMVNNRLGIMNREEGFLGYLLKEVLYSISESKKKQQV